MSTTTKNQFFGTNNFFVPGVYMISAGYLENAYPLELPGLEKMLCTQKFLMDEMSGQFYAVYGNSYQ